MERICRDFDPTMARLLNAVIEMFNMLGHALECYRWLLKVADAAAEASSTVVQQPIIAGHEPRTHASWVPP